MNNLFGVINSGPRHLLVQGIVQRNLRERAESYLRGRLIDIGCGSKPYRGLIAPYVDEHIGVDHEGSKHSQGDTDLVGTAYDIPVEDETFDSALCTAVLEHLEEPEMALRECFRVLRPGGTAVYTVPFIWHLHEEPRDFYRFSKYGLEYLFRKAGFNLVEVTPLSGFWVTFGTLLVYQLHRANRGPLKWTRIIDVIGLGMQGGAYLLDRLDRSEKWTWMYIVVVQKPDRADP